MSLSSAVKHFHIQVDSLNLWSLQNIMSEKFSYKSGFLMCTGSMRYWAHCSLDLILAHYLVFRMEIVPSYYD